MLMNGLLEAFPTEEQIEKVRMCGWLFTGVGGIWESICLINWPLHTRDFSRELSGFSCIIGMRMV